VQTIGRRKDGIHGLLQEHSNVIRALSCDQVRFYAAHRCVGTREGENRIPLLLYSIVNVLQWAPYLQVESTTWSQLQFLEVCKQGGVLQQLKTHMVAYNKRYPIKILNGLFVDATSVQIDTCRLAALMIEPCMGTFLANKCSPGQGRDHTDNPQLRARALTQECMQELQRLHSNVEFVPQANASITLYCPDIFISTAYPAETRDYAWICSTFQTIKTTMGTLITNFTGSGKNSNEFDDSVRDLDFWERFCKRQPMWMYIYLLWDHGRHTSLAWNTILLPETQTFDLGGSDVIVPPTPPTSPPPHHSSSKKKGGKKRVARDEEEDALLAVSQGILQKLSTPPPSSQNSGSTSSRKEVETAQAAKAFSEHADVLRKQLREVDAEDSQGVKALLTASLTTVLKKLAALTD
jgi:hypothetical protein